MNTLPPSHRAPGAFTLIELLTVITIIAILMGLLFPAMGMVKEQGRKTQAKNDVTQITTAIKAYYTEYGKYPPTSTTTPTSDEYTGGDKGSNAELFNVLRSRTDGSTVNANYAGNTRRIPFFEGRGATDPAKPKNGFGSDGQLYDPWGKAYGIAIDYDYDNKISTLPYADFKNDNAPNTGVGVFSLGKDAIIGSKDTAGNYRKGSTISDDVISWQ